MNQLAKKSYRTISAASLLLALTGCLGLGGSKGPPIGTFLLSPELLSAPHSAGPSPKGKTVVVAAPQAVPGYDTSRIAYVRRPHEIRHYAYSEWADEPARMLQPLVIRALEATGCWTAVVPAPAAVEAEYRLDIDGLTLVHSYFGEPSRARIELNARLVKEETAAVMGHRHFEATAVASTENAYGGVSAANRATGELIRELSVWLGRQVQCNLTPVSAESSAKSRQGTLVDNM